MDAYRILQKMTFNKNINATVVKAVRTRLERLLQEEERSYAHWKQNIEHKLNQTRRKEIRRKFEKVITSYKIVIYHLTPFFERTDDIPALINRKTNRNED